jgi:hypothetical protein
LDDDYLCEFRVKSFDHLQQFMERETFHGLKNDVKIVFILKSMD